MDASLIDAVTPCPRCRREVALKLTACPHCAEAADSSSPFLPFRYVSGGQGVIDQQTVAFLRSNAPQPAQSILDELVDRSTRVRISELVIHGNRGIFEPILEISAPEDRAALRSALRIEASEGHLMSFEDRRLEFFAGEHSLATLGLIGAYVLRWSNCWKTDAHLLDSDAIAEFFADRGCPELREELRRDRELDDGQAREAEQWQTSWNASMPSGLADLVQSLSEETEVPDAPSRRRALQILADCYPTTEARILALLAWFGHGLGRWSGFPSEECAPESLLETFDDADVLAAASHGGLSAQQLEGAARFFCRWIPPAKRRRHRLEIPRDLRQRLWAHVQRSGEVDKVARARPFLEII